MEIFLKIVGKYENKWVQRDCKKLIKKFSYKSEKDLGVLTELIVLMYIYNDCDSAIELHHMIENVKFTGNYNIWNNIRNAKWIIARIYRETGQDEENKKIVESLLPYEVKSLYDNQKEILKSYDRDISNAKERNSKREMIGWMLIKYEIMLRFIENPEFPIDKDGMNDEATELKKMLRELL